MIAGARTAQAARGGSAVAKQIGISVMRCAEKVTSDLGSGTRAEAKKLGRAWVADGYEVASDGKTLVSADGLRQFRPPSFKPNLGIEQANFERRLIAEGKWLGTVTWTTSHESDQAGPKAAPQPRCIELGSELAKRSRLLQLLAPSHVWS